MAAVQRHAVLFAALVVVLSPVCLATAADKCLVFSTKNESALAYPQDLGIQWLYTYDTQWWLGNFHDVSNPSRLFGLEISIARINGNSANCSHSQGLALVFLGVSDSKTQTYTQRSMTVNLTNPGDVVVTSTSTPYKVFVGGAAGGMAIGVEEQSHPAGVHHVSRGGTTAVTGRYPQNSQLMYARNVEGFNASFKIQVDTPGVLQNVAMSDDGWLDLAITYFTQMAQPQLSGSAALVLQGESIQLQGDMYLQHMWGTDPLSRLGRTGLLPPPGQHSVPKGIYWTWQMARLDNGLYLSLVKFIVHEVDGVKGDGAPPQYVNVVNSTSGTSTYLSGFNLTITLSDMWVSPVTGQAYARRSDVSIPSLDMKVTWMTLVPDNEHHVPSLTYYEAASRVNGTMGGVPISGNGYLEHRVP